MKYSIKNNNGQVLVTLLVFTVIAVAVTTTAVSIMINITQSTSIMESRISASQAAEGAIENAILRLLRDPNYTGETLPVGDATVLITVTGSGPYIITAESELNTFVQTIQATVGYTNNRLTVTNWEYIN